MYHILILSFHMDKIIHFNLYHGSCHYFVVLKNCIFLSRLSLMVLPVWHVHVIENQVLIHYVGISYFLRQAISGPAPVEEQKPLARTIKPVLPPSIESPSKPVSLKLTWYLACNFHILFHTCIMYSVVSYKIMISLDAFISKILLYSF